MPEEEGAGASENTEEPEPKGGASGTDHAAEAAKWKALARKNESQAKANADAAKKLAELEEKDKSEQQKLTDKATVAEKRAADAETARLRIEVALEKAPDGMSLAQVRKLAKRLSGDSQEEMEADAEELFADFAPDDKKKPETKPKPRLRGGLDPDDDGDGPSTKDIVAAIPRN